MNTATPNGVHRFTASDPCPVCGGSDRDPRGQGVRCHGYLSSDGKFIFCAREDHAGKARHDAGSDCYRHTRRGPCPCGVEHAPADPKPARRGGLGEVDQIYRYHGPDGAVLFEVVRFKNPKDFRQRRPGRGPDGKDRWGLGGVEPVLYKLPLLMQARPGDAVWLVEGEKDADRLGALGLLATTSPMGAGKWRDAYAETLRDLHVVILPDNDGKGQQHAQQAARSLHGIAASVRVVELPGVPEKGDVSDWLAAGGTVATLKEMARQSAVWTPCGTPEILVTTAEHEVIRQAVSALLNESNLFQRGGSLVTILADCKPKPNRHDPTRPAGSLRIALLPSAQIRRLMTVHAAWRKARKDRGGNPEIVPAHPPAWAVEGVATLGHWPGIRPIEGITETPTLRPDGSLISKPGYDDDTGLWLAPNGDFPEIPDRPTLAEAKAACDALYDVVADFPFEKTHHRATWLAALLTPLARWAIDGPCPLFLFDANCPGTGKTKLCDIIAIITTGREMPRGAYPDDQDEMQKMLLSVAMAADRLILFDNVPTGFGVGGSALDRALTARTMKGRILGRSQMTPDLAVDVVMYATGNNLGLRGDSLRRVVPCRLQTTEERPEERRDFKVKGDLLAHVKHNRGALVSAALTILRGYIAAGRPDRGLIPMDYPAWCGLIRNAVEWATGVDPCESRKELIASDEETNTSRALIAGWKALCEAEGKTSLSSAAAVEIIDADKGRHAALKAILASWSKDGKLPSPQSIGNRLNKIRGRNIDGQMLDHSYSSGIREWFVRPACVQPTGATGATGATENPSVGNFPPRSSSLLCKAVGDGTSTETPAAPAAPNATMRTDWRNPDPNPY